MMINTDRYLRLSLREKIDKFLSLSLLQQLCFLFGLYAVLYVIFAVLLNVFGGEAHPVKNWWWWAYVHMVDTGNINDIAAEEMNSHFVSFIGVLMHILTLFLFGGIFISVFTSFFEETSQKAQKGEVRYDINEPHYVILGWDVVGASIVHKLLCGKAEEKMPVVILSEREPDDIRNDILKFAADSYADANQTQDTGQHKTEKLDETLLYVFKGPFTNSEELTGRSLALDKAKKIYVLGEKNSLRRDSDTVYIAVNNCDIEKECKGHGVPLIANLRSLTIFNQLKSIAYKPNNEDKDIEDRRAVDVTMFNFYENWARRIWSHIPENDSEDSYCALAYTSVTKDNFVHLFVIGFGQMGQALAIEAARVAHYANGKKTRITIIDGKLDEKKSKFVTVFKLKRLENTDGHAGELYSWSEEYGMGENAEKTKYEADVEFEFIDKLAESKEVQAMLVDAGREAAEGRQIPTVAITFSDLDAALDLALSLPKELTAHENKIPILVRNENDLKVNKFNMNKAGSSDRSWNNIQFFGNLKECTDIDEKIEKFATVLNALYDLYELWKKASEYKTVAGCQFVKPYELWKKASEYNRWASRHQALAFVERFRAAGYVLSVEKFPAKSLEDQLTVSELPNYNEEGPKIFGDAFERLGIAEHDRWSVEKWLDGWTYGWTYDKEKGKVIKDSANRYHPDLVKYEDLKFWETSDERQKERDKDRRPLALAKWILENYCGVKVSKESSNKTEG